MRTNIDINDALMAEAMEVTGTKTKKAAVEEALRRLVEANRVRRVIEDTAGIGWEGDLQELRELRSFD